MNVQAAIWHDLARQAAEAAGKMREPELRAAMLGSAAGYEALARHAEKLPVITKALHTNDNE